MTWLDLGSGVWPAPAPWINLDHERVWDQIVPDVRGSLLDLPYRDGCAERVYMGHVLEHLDWPLVAKALREVRRVAVAGARVCVVGPDVFRAIHRWHKGLEPWSIVEACLEGHLSFQPVDMVYDRHRWNATQGRVVDALRRSGFSRVRAVSMRHVQRQHWPVTSGAPWQCAVTAVVP